MKHLAVISIILTVFFLANCDGSKDSADETAHKKSGLLLFEDNFDSPVINTDIWIKDFAEEKSYAATIVPNPINDMDGSDTVIRFELRKDDPDVHSSRRSEINMRGKNDKIPQNCERWYAFKIFIPSDYETDTASEILAQWHGSPDTGIDENGDQILLEPYTNPCLALFLTNDNWSFRVVWDSEKISNGTTADKYSIGSWPVTKGEWTSWVFHIKWGWNSSHNTILEIYKNGELIANCNGKPNASNDDLAPYFKLGIYKWDWAGETGTSITDKRIVYYNSFKIGDENCSLEDMTP